MNKLIRIIKKLSDLETKAGCRYLSQGGLYDSDDETYLKLVGYYRDGINLCCSLITKKDLRSLNWFELCVLIDATNPGDKLRQWVYNRQKQFPTNISEEKFYQQRAEFNAHYAQSLL